VIGLGSPHGDDAVGLAVADRLAGERLPSGVGVCACTRPGVDLLDLLEGAAAAVLVDGMRGGSTPGSVYEIDPAALAPGGAVSSHGLGVAEALALGRALGRLPARLHVVGIEIGPLRGDGLSAPVAAAVEPACARVRSLLAACGAAPGEAD